jgi:outer membrane protein OmpA-like peptidoglycan-associated protein
MINRRKMVWIALRPAVSSALALLFLPLAPSSLQAQEDEYQKWLKKDQEKWVEFKAKDDREFADFLKKDWHAMQVFAGMVADEKPKPVKTPVFTPPPGRSEEPPPTSPPVKLAPVPGPVRPPTVEPKPETKVEPPPEPILLETKKEELKVEVGKALVLDGIEFESGKAVIKPQSEPVLEKAFNTLHQNPEIVVEIRGHTDNTGKRAANMKVSQGRAESVRAWLIAKGIPAKRIRAKGCGPDFPVGDNKTAEGRQMNRRIEFFRMEDVAVASPLPPPGPKAQPQPESRPQPRPEPKAPPQPEAKPEVQAQPAPEPEPEPLPKLDPAPTLLPNTSLVDMTFFEVPFTLRRDNKLVAAPVTTWDNGSIADYWKFLAETEYDDLLKQARAKKDQLGLNDWGFTLLLYDIGKHILGNSQQQSTLFAWFMLLKSGYDVRVGYADNKIYLLIPSDNKLFSIPYLTLGLKGVSRRYYALNPEPKAPQMSGQLYTYNGSYLDASSTVNFNVPQIPRLRDAVQTRPLSFRYKGKEYKVTARFSSAAIAYFADYPQTNFEVYFNSKPSREATESLVNSLRPMVAGLSEWEAVNFLLRFVQTAFVYETDDQQFGREKPFFPDECLYYKACDCEDRAVLLSYLVRRLTSMEVVGLDYPGHMSMAVRFSTDVPGTTIVQGSKKFTIADPTYINANVGDCMPEFRNVNPNVIVLPPLRDGGQ